MGSGRGGLCGGGEPALGADGPSPMRLRSEQVGLIARAGTGHTCPEAPARSPEIAQDSPRMAQDGSISTRIASGRPWIAPGEPLDGSGPVEVWYLPVRRG